MKLSKIIALILVVILVSMSVLVGCNDNSKLKTIYAATEADKGSMQAIFYSSKTDESKEVEMKKVDTKDKLVVYSVSEDTDKYDFVSFTRNNEDKTMNLSFSQYVSGWYLSPYGVVPYTYNEEVKYDVKFETVRLKYNENREKKIFIWTPDSYDPSDKDTKYSVIYMTDGQNLYEKSSTSYGSWAVAQSVEAMNSINENTKAIIVGIDDGDGYRDSELTPNIGKPQATQEAFEDGTGKEFSDFVYNTVVPYIEENYNVYTDKDHNSICGSSSGGIESFYIGINHPDKFGTIGALSPAFFIFPDDAWKEYLPTLDFNGNYPTVYIYNGANEKDDLETTLLKGAQSMKDNLATINYPMDLIYEQYLIDGAHNERYWRGVFPQFLSYAFK